MIKVLLSELWLRIPERNDLNFTKTEKSEFRELLNCSGSQLTWEILTSETDPKSLSPSPDSFTSLCQSLCAQIATSTCMYGNSDSTVLPLLYISLLLDCEILDSNKHTCISHHPYPFTSCSQLLP